MNKLSQEKEANNSKAETTESATPEEKRQERIKRKRTKPTPLSSKQRELVRLVSAPYFYYQTRSELERNIPLFLEYLQANRDSLIQTGFPKESFSNLFFQSNLTILYPTKIPVNFYGEKTVRQFWHSQLERRKQERKNSATSEDEKNIVYSYIWEKNAERFYEGRRTFDDINGLPMLSREPIPESGQKSREELREEAEKWLKDSTFLTNSNLHRVNYEKAGHLSFLNQEEITLIESLREPLLELRIKLLRLLLNLLHQEEDIPQFKEKMFKELTNFNSLQLATLQQIDSKYQDNKIDEYLNRFETRPRGFLKLGVKESVLPLCTDYLKSDNKEYCGSHTGTLTALTYWIGFLVNEIEYGTIEEFKNRLTSLSRGFERHLDMMSFNPSRLSVGSLSEKRGQIMGSLDHLYSQFSGEKLRERLESYLLKLDSFAHPHAKREIAFNGELYHSHYEKYSVNLKELFQSYCNSINKTGDFSIVGTHSEKSGEESLMKRMGECWKFVFRGEESFFTDTKGLNMIALLLSHPDKELEVGFVERLGVVDGDFNQKLETPDKDFAYSRHLGEILDPEALEQYKERLRVIDEKIEDEEEFGNFEAVAELEQEKTLLQDELTRISHSKNREKAPELERSRSRVKKNLNKTLKVIERFHPALASFLDKNIKTGTTLIYKPEESPEYFWKVIKE